MALLLGNTTLNAVVSAWTCTNTQVQQQCSKSPCPVNYQRVVSYATKINLNLQLPAGCAPGACTPSALTADSCAVTYVAAPPIQSTLGHAWAAHFGGPSR